MKWTKRRLTEVIVLLGVSLAFEVGNAADKFDIRVNDDSYQVEQLNPRVAVNFAGEFVVAWVDKRNGRSEIFFQYFDSTGTPLEGNQQISTSGVTAPQFGPSLDANQLGQFGAVWSDYRNGSYPFDPDIYFAAIDIEGAGTNLSITDARQDSTCESPDIAVLPGGNIISVWADYRNRNWDIFGQRLSASGSEIGGNTKLNSESASAQQHSPRVASLANGGYIVVWYDNRLGNDDIYGRIFDAQGNPLAPDFKINDDDGQARQAFPAVAADGNGRFFVAWVDWRNGVYPKNPDVYFRRYDQSGNPLGTSVKIISDADKKPQKDVSLCADRMGNLAVVWADSTSGQWDAMAQMVDHTGNIDGPSFLIHQNTTGRQLQPDVATDGYKFFFVWSDSRNGDFDVFLTIKEYNDPTIVSYPGALTFTMEAGGDLPATKTIRLTNAGYGELNWTASPSVSWLSITPSSGTTPSDVQVRINTDTLQYGEYVCQIRLIDLVHDDSSEAVSVILNVTAPIIEISPDTIYFKALAEVGDPSPRSILIDNSGSGSFSWDAVENSDWFSIDPQSGSSGDHISIVTEIAGLEYGTYLDPLIVTSDQAINSPETVLVSLELVGNMPYLRATPDTILLNGNESDVITSQLEISNPGSGSLDWAAVSSVEWLELDRYTGTDYDMIIIGVNLAQVTSGSYRTDLIIYDSASFNQMIQVPVFLYLSSGDTVQFANANASPGGIGAMPLLLKLINPAKAVYIPIQYDISTAALDSIVPNVSAFDSYVNFFSGISGDRAEVGLRVDDAVFESEIIAPGEYDIGTLFFRAGEAEVFNLIDTLSSDSAGLYILTESMARKVPAVIPGNLVIGNPTYVNETGTTPLPEVIRLSQNFPNPFNSSTAIDLYINRAMRVSLTIYNILGQTVYEFDHAEFPAGNHRFIWDGTLKNSSHMAPSGIYFYRLESSDFCDVKKMVLLK